MHNSANNKYILSQVISAGTNCNNQFWLCACESALTSALYTSGDKVAAPPNINWAETEKTAKCLEPPLARSNGLIATCNRAMAVPIKNNADIATAKIGKLTNNTLPNNASENAISMTFFSPKLCTNNPAGIDITPYAIKNANGKKPARVKPIL